jgi:hypothetical protein
MHEKRWCLWEFGDFTLKRKYEVKGHTGKDEANSEGTYGEG